HLPRTSPVDVEHYALKLALDPRARTIAGECRIRFHPRHDLVQVLELDLDTLDVAGVSDEEGRSLSFERRPGVVAIDFGAPLEAGTSHEVVVRYGGVPRRGLWFAGARDGVPTHAFTQGQCDDSRGWFPCIDEPAERATSELEVSLPRGWISVAAGEKVESRARADGGTVDLWRMNVPHPAYLTTLVAGELVEVRSRWNGVPLALVAEPALDEHLEASFEPTAEILQFFEDLTGARYPYAKYSQAVVANFPHGGMENISATTLTDACVGDERGRRDYDPTGLIAHEAAHQWFGNILRPGIDPGGNILSEGMAHYSSARLIRQIRGERMRMAFMRNLEFQYGIQRSADDELPMTETDGSRSGDQTVTYDKGGWVFWMLMEHMGEERMDAAMRDFIGAFKDGPDHPLLQDLVEALRPHAPDAAAYDAFTKQWFYDVVVPEFKVESATVTAPAKDGDPWQTVITVRNANTATVPLEVAVTNGEERWPDASICRTPKERAAAATQRPEYRDARARGTISAGETIELTIESDFKPTKAVVDPDVRTLMLNRKLAERDL
ncbi:MAG: M1 family metallopeptidase, partial [Planctomycetota bacterium]